MRVTDGPGSGEFVDRNAPFNVLYRIIIDIEVLGDRCYLYDRWLQEA